MKTLLVLILTALSARVAVAGTVESGPPITAAQLASQLNLFNYSLVYRQDHPFKKVRFALTYKERRPDGSYVETVSLVVRTCPLTTPQTEVPLVIFVGKERSTVSLDNGVSGGKGCNLGELYTTGSPPVLRKGGGYILLRTIIDQRVRDTEENTRGILELEIEGVE